jgi:hypothetical protein
MIDKVKYPKLHELLQNRITMRKKWLQEAIAARSLAGKLPEEILQMEITDIDTNSDGSLDITINGDNNPVIVGNLVRLGATGLDPKVFWTSNIGARGTLVLEDKTKVTIDIFHLPKPANCHIKRTERTFTEETLVCDNTGEEPSVAAVLAEE